MTTKTLTADEILDFVAAHAGIEREAMLAERPVGSEARLALWLIQEYVPNLSTRKLADTTGISQSTISRALNTERTERWDDDERKRFGNAIEDAMVDAPVRRAGWGSLTGTLPEARTERTLTH